MLFVVVHHAWTMIVILNNPLFIINDNSFQKRIEFIAFNPLTPKITDFLTHFWPLLTKRKRECIITKPCILNIFRSPLSIYDVKITLPYTGKPIWRILFKKVPKIWNFFFILFFFKWIKHIDLFRTMDKGGQNSFSLCKIFFGPAHYVLSFPKWRKTMEIWKIGIFLWHF